MRVAERNFLEPHTVDQTCRRDVQMSGHDGGGTIAAVPIVRRGGAAPEFETWIARDVREILGACREYMRTLASR